VAPGSTVAHHATMPWSGRVGGIVAANQLAYLAVDDFPTQEVVVIDVSDPAAPAIVGKTATRRFDVQGELAINSGRLIVGSSELWVFDLTNPSGPTRSRRWSGQNSTSLATTNTGLFVGGSSVRLFRVGRWLSGREVGASERMFWGGPIAARNNDVYVADSLHGLIVLEARRPY
jgi:hypothetical protein